ncbi:unnamed protein product [Protopolystoma xenopodis]|uniref:Clathrin/coatomer adaptor adaptin-like N-terminal domain-containing protein n=1 Tax=Protopolystoma xenopodis TaxID=117903 RepID=A0A3S5BF30_9PLAT|nr:unnamed protein product [Protopolystoma xenopodis]
MLAPSFHRPYFAQTSDHKKILVRIVHLVDSMTVPSARASILWLLGEYCHRVPKLAPDVLRKMAKSFMQEEPIVKLQFSRILSLASSIGASLRMDCPFRNTTEHTLLLSVLHEQIG